MLPEIRPRILNELTLQQDYENSHQYKLKQSWVDQIRDRKPKLLMTITVKNFQTDASFIKMINSFLHFINATLFKKRYKAGEQYLTGFAALEHQAYGNPHIHILVENKISDDELEKVVRKHISKFPQLTNMGIRIDKINQSDDDFLKIGGYLQKECDGFMLMDKNGVK